MKGFWTAAKRLGWREGLNVLATVLTIVVCAAVLWTIVLDARRSGAEPIRGPRAAASGKPVRPPNPAPPSLPAAPVSVTGSMSKGSAAAKVGILEYSDYQCPFCGAFARDTFPQLDKKYIDTGKVRFIYRDFPLESIHPNAMPAALSARCAGQQGKFWEMQQLLFGHQKELTGPKFDEWAGELKIDTKKFDVCRTDDVAARARADEASGTALAVAGTPTFFIGVFQADGTSKVLERFSGAKPLSNFQATLDPLIATAAQAPSK